MGDTSPVRSGRARWESDQKRSNEDVQSDILVATESAERDEAPEGVRRGRHERVRLGQRGEPHSGSEIADDPLHRLLLLTRGGGRLRMVVVIVMAATHQMRGHLAGRHELVYDTMKRKNATADEECHRRQERDGRSCDPGGGNDAASHRTEMVMQFTISNTGTS